VGCFFFKKNGVSQPCLGPIEDALWTFVRESSPLPTDSAVLSLCCHRKVLNFMIKKH